MEDSKATPRNGDDAEPGSPPLCICALGSRKFLARLNRLSSTSSGTIPPFMLGTSAPLSTTTAALSLDLYDAVLIELSGADDLNFLTNIHEHFPATPVVACGPDDPSSAARAIRLGALEYIPELRPSASALTRGLLMAVERARTERSLRDSESKYRTLVEQSPDGFLLSVPAPGMPILGVNQRMCQITGYSEEELLRLGLPDILVAEETQAAPFRVDEVLSGKTMLRERNMVRKDGTLVPTESTTRVLPDGSVQIVVRDITERKQAEEALRASEERYRTLVDILPNIVMLTALDGKIVFCNKQGLEMHGFTSIEQVVGLDAVELVAPEYRERSVEAMRKTLEEGSVQEVELILLKANGASYSGLLSAAVIYDHDGRPAGFVRVVRDISGRKRSEARIRQLNEELEEKVARRTAELEAANEQLRDEITERRRAEDAVRQNEQQFKAVFESSIDAMFLLDDHGRVIDANSAACDLAGTSREELLAGDIRNLVSDASFEKARQTWHTAISEGVAYSEARIVRLDGQTRDVEYNVRVNVVPGYHLAVLHDITLRKRAQDDLQVVNTGLTIAMQELEAFSYSVSHDLQAPLRAISGYSTALSDEFSSQLSGDGSFYLARIQANTRKMSELIEDLLAFSRTARQAMSTTLIDMGELAGEVIASLDLTQASRDLRFQVDALPAVRGDRAMLRSVLANLLANAVKFTRPTEHPVIEIGSYPDPGSDQEVFYVKDNGVGFDETYRDKLFMVFQRLHASSEFEGTGVGLAIVQRIIQRHGGRVWAEGKVGDGATFYFTLPVERLGVQQGG